MSGFGTANILVKPRVLTTFKNGALNKVSVTDIDIDRMAPMIIDEDLQQTVTAHLGSNTNFVQT